jgi:hypothetical protein
VPIPLEELPVKKKKTPAPRRAGTAVDQEARFARILDAAGDDPASLILMISVMGRIIADRDSRRRDGGREEIY